MQIIIETAHTPMTKQFVRVCTQSRTTSTAKKYAHVSPYIYIYICLSYNNNVCLNAESNATTLPFGYGMGPGHTEHN